jgi:pyridoxine 5-phosphate synthase
VKPYLILKKNHRADGPSSDGKTCQVFKRIGGLMSRLAGIIDQIALIRNMFADIVPDPAHAAVLAELGGADSSVCHLREDLSSVNERDIKILREISKTHLNIRSASNAENIGKLLKLKNVLKFAITCYYVINNI